MTRTLSELLRSYDVPPQLHDRLARVVYNLGGGRVPFVFTTTILGNLVNAVDTALLTTPPLNPGIDSAVVLLYGTYCVNSIGTNGVGVQTRIHQGATVAGATINPTVLQSGAAGTNVTCTLVAVDTPGAVAGVQYTMSGSVTSATANSNVNQGCLIALALG